MCFLGWVLATWCYLSGGLFMVEFLDNNKPFSTRTREKLLNIIFVVFWPIIMFAGLIILINTKARGK